MNPSDTTILVVDDEPVVLDTVRDGLIGHGYQVLSATGGDEALQVAQAHRGPIALAVVDVVMPAISGPEAIQRGSPRRQPRAIRCWSSRSASTRSDARSTTSSTTAPRSRVPCNRRADPHRIFWFR
jgi:CheY-like chemotaxis protein